MFSWRESRFGWALAAALGALAVVAPAGASAAPSYPEAVVMVSGYNSSTAFTTPDASCEGQEGGTWNNPNGPAPALRAAGFMVFTAPVHQGTASPPPPCAPGPTPVPPAADEIDSFGDNDLNGAALADFLAFLHANYGVDRVQLVAHSDGGNWSRSAMTQSDDFTGLDVRSLTTLGTPYTGSAPADFSSELVNGKCDFSDKLEQDVCEALLGISKDVFNGMGPTAIKELTHTYLESWNEKQTIGSCSVTTIAGTGVDLPLIPFSYYNPSDGLVGEASALGHSAYALPSFDLIPAPDIPGLADGGTFPVVHAPSIPFKKANLLNTPAISTAVVNIVSNTPSSGPLCNGDALDAPEPTKHRFVLPLRVHHIPSKRGVLGHAVRGDLVIAKPGTSVLCGRAKLPLVPLLGDKRASIALPDECSSRLRIRASGNVRRKAMLVRASAKRDIVASLRDDQLRVYARGGQVENLRATLKVGGKTRQLKLDGKGRAQLPSSGRSATLIVRAGVDGQRLSASSPLDL